MDPHKLNPGLKHKPTNQTAKTRVQQSSHARLRVEITQKPRHASPDPTSRSKLTRLAGEDETTICFAGSSRSQNRHTHLRRMHSFQRRASSGLFRELIQSHRNHHRHFITSPISYIFTAIAPSPEIIQSTDSRSHPQTRSQPSKIREPHKNRIRDLR